MVKWKKYFKISHCAIQFSKTKDRDLDLFFVRSWWLQVRFVACPQISFLSIFAQKGTHLHYPKENAAKTSFHKDKKNVQGSKKYFLLSFFNITVMLRHADLFGKNGLLNFKIITITSRSQFEFTWSIHPWISLFFYNAINEGKLSTETYRQQPSPLLYSIDIWPARNSRLTQRETNH